MNSVFWLGAIVLMLIIEAITLGLTTIWFAGGALAAFLLSLATDNILVEFVVFFAVSLLLLIYTNGYEIIRGHLKQVMKGVAVQ